LLALLVLLACAATSPQALGQEPSDQNVFIVVIDGVRYSETFGDPQHRYIPMIWNVLRPKGAIITSFYNRGQTVTSGAHGSLLTGNESWLHQEHIEPPYSEDELSRPFTPTLFEHYRAATGADASKAWLIANHARFLEGVSYSRHPAYGPAYGATWFYGPGSDYQMWQRLAAVMDQYHPRLVTVNLHQTDMYAHQGSWEGYTMHILMADLIVYQLWSKIERHPFYSGRTTLIVTSDHGRHTRDFTDHGDCCDGCQHVMFLALGPAIRRGYQSAIERHLEDIPLTAARIMGLTLPYAVDGAVMEELFAAEPAPEQGRSTSAVRTRLSRFPRLRTFADLPVPVTAEQIDEQSLSLDAVTLNGSGQPQSVFRRGGVVGLRISARNLGPGPVTIYMGRILVPGCHRGMDYGDDPISLPPGASLTTTVYALVPPWAPLGTWPLVVEFRGLNQDGDLVIGSAAPLVRVLGL
jgi:hypothetical protein